MRQEIQQAPARHGLQIFLRADGLGGGLSGDSDQCGQGAHARQPARQPHVDPRAKLRRQLIRGMDRDHYHIGGERGVSRLKEDFGIIQGVDAVPGVLDILPSKLLP